MKPILIIVMVCLTVGSLLILPVQAGAWSTRLINADSFTGSPASMALDRAAGPHFCYISAGNRSLHLSWNDGTEWHAEMIAPGPVTSVSELVLDTGGNHTVAFCNSTGLNLAAKSGDAWEIGAVPGAGCSPSLALGARGFAALSSTGQDGALLFSWQDAGGWHTETVPGVASASGSSSLRLDARGDPHIGFMDDAGLLRYAWKDTMGWHTGIVGGDATMAPVVPDHQNSPPLAGPDRFTGFVDTDLIIAGPGILANDRDPDGDALTALPVSGCTHGNLTLAANGSFVYRPAAGFKGVDGFVYRASDGSLVSSLAPVSLVIAESNVPEYPVAAIPLVVFAVLLLIVLVFGKRWS